MPWSLEYHSETKIVLCTYSGQLSLDEFKEATERTIALAVKHKTNLLLIDDSKLEPAVSAIDIYEMPRFYDKVEGDRKSRIALILPPSGQIREDVKFYETVCRNHGWNVKSFDEPQGATDWLLS